MPLFDLNATTVVLSSVAVVCVLYIFRPPSARPYAPGPPPSRIPFIGNLRDFQALEEPEYYHEWAGEELKEKYGDVIQLSMPGQKLLFVNSLKALTDLFSREVCSDRPRFTMAGDIMGVKEATVLAPYGSYWKAHRKMLQQTIGDKEMSKEFARMADEESRMLMTRLGRDGANSLEEIRLMVAKWILRITYGMRIESLQDDFIRDTEEVGRVVGASMKPGTFFVDLFPAMKYIPSWFPFAGWKRHGEKLRREVESILTVPYDHVATSLANGTQKAPSITSFMIQKAFAEPRSQRFCAGNIYGASIPPNTIFLHQLLACMLLFPKVQVLAQKELDSVVGSGRLPRFEDKENLPYMNALIQELYRWQTPGPIGVARRMMQDDTYRGFFIEKGTTVIPNNWSIARDPAVYPDPLDFKPERFLGPNPQVDPRTFVFGAGRRICPGKTLSENLLFVVTAHILLLFDICQPLDGNGEEYFPDILKGRFLTWDGIVPFDVRLVPRKEKLLESLGLEHVA